MNMNSIMNILEEFETELFRPNLSNVSLMLSNVVDR